MNNNVAIKQEDHTTFTQIYTHYQKPLYNFLHSLTRSHEVAEDITHNVFAELWEHREQIDYSREIRGYLFRVAHKMAMRHYRQRKIANNHFTYKWMQSIEDIAPEELLFAKEADLLVEVAISKMPKKRQQIFGLFYKEGMSYDLIASTLQINKATVANHLTHAKNDIRKILNLKK